MKISKYYKYILGAVGIVVVSYVVGAMLNSLALGGGRFVGAWVMLDKRTFGVAGLAVVAAGIVMLSREYDRFWSKRGKKLLDAGKDRMGGNLEDSSFMGDTERDKAFEKIEISDMEKRKVAGVIVRAEEIGDKYEVNFARGSHAMVIGTTGSGKTTAYINPVIRVLSETGMKPSMLIADPKGELTQLHQKDLEERGYEVKVVNLRSPFSSVKWNPLTPIYRKNKEMLEASEKIKVIEERGVYSFEGKEYGRYEDAVGECNVKKQRLFDEAYEDLHDIVSGLCPIINKHEPIWESGARNFALAIALAMLEDSGNAELGMGEDRFNLYNLTKIATESDKNCAGLKKYFSGRGVLSKAASLARQVLNSAENTRNSYLTTLYDKLGMFSDMGICSMTSGNEIDFGCMGDKPTAIFLQIPDEKETRHTLASILILQAYKELVAKANLEKDLTLSRPVYFILDEFGNLPPVHKLEQMVTVGRSRNIWLTLVVQSYAQLSKVYGSEAAEIIKSNCNVQIYIGTTDQKTLEDFSKRCGNYAVMKKSVGTSTSKSEEYSENFSFEERPLVYPSELQRLNKPGDMGNAVVTVFGFNPLKTRFTPSFECKVLKFNPSYLKDTKARYFDEEDVFYDMKKRSVLEIARELDIKVEKKTKRIKGKGKDYLVKLVDILDKIIGIEEVEEILALLEDGDIKLALKKIRIIRDRALKGGQDEIVAGLYKADEIILAI